MVSARSRTSAPISVITDEYKFKNVLLRLSQSNMKCHHAAQSFTLTLASHGDCDIKINPEFTVKAEKM